ncbi:MAG TPA: hypothetical protein VM283_04760 [Armatimonadota bacterium]|nr:hypothetical protein [Armatimonadota bacterium]
MSDAIKWVRTVYEDGRHNAFTDIKLFQGRWYVVFRSAMTHGSFDGVIRLMVSDDLESWEQAALLQTVLDDRDPKLTIRDGKLHVIAQCRIPPCEPENAPARVQSHVWSSPDGASWSCATVGEPIDHVFWRPKEHGGWHWMAPYFCDRRDREIWHVPLMRSQDLCRWEQVSMVFDSHSPNETELEFLADGTLVAFVRTEDADYGTPFCLARPPYTDWEVIEQPLDIRGPMLAQADGKLFVVGRYMEKGEETWLRDTRLYRVTDDYQLEEMATLPHPEWAPERGGDNSYAGLHDLGGGEALISWYSGTTDRANAYLALVDLA